MSGLGGAEPTSIGRYELRSVLGIGGFATVHHGFDTSLASDVAIKVLLPQYVAHEDIGARFVQEAQLLRRVESPHVVRVYDIGELDDGRPYFVMEYLDGGALFDRIDGGTDRASLARIVDALAHGLEALHDSGVVHRDIKPDNLLIGGSAVAGGTRMQLGLLATDERVVIGDLGLAKDLDITSAGPTILGGTPLFQAPEQTEPNAAITRATDIYASTAVLWNLLCGAPPPPHQSVAAALPAMPPEWQPILERGLQRDPGLRYGSISEWADDARHALLASPETDTVSARIGDVANLCPYKGMAAYQPDDAGLFFGRDDMVDSLVARLQTNPVLVIGGPSGSGKSSLLRAGLIPRLGRGAIAGSQKWNVSLFTPGRDAVGELIHQVRKLRPDSTEPLTRDDLPNGARRWLDDGDPSLLAIDQFEELFTLDNGRADQELFVATLEAMTESEHSRTRIALALRADFYGACAAHPWLADRINQSQLLVGPMTRRELRDAITMPAQRAGLNLEEGLTDTILDDVGSGAGALPLLGHALMETWLRRRGSELTTEGYRGAGGVSGAIAQRADHVCTGLSDAEQESARSLLLRLTTPGQGTPDTRRRLDIAELSGDVQLTDVMQKLATARLLTVDDQTVEVAHEALLHSWPRLRRWIDEDRESLQERRRIGSAAAEWDGQNRTPDLLYRGTPLAAALEWLDDHPGQLDDVSSAFLLDARDVRDNEEREIQIAAAGRRRTRRLAIAVLSTLTIAAVLASVVAFAALRRSRADEETAQEQQIQALAAAASAQASQQPLLATALALESIERGDPSTAAARQALIEARVGIDLNRWTPQPFGNPVNVGDVLSVAISRDGATFITGGRLGSVVFWDRTSRVELHRFDDAHDHGVQDIDTSPDGHWALSSGRSKALLWDLSAEPPEAIAIAMIDELEGPIWDGAFSPDSSRIAIATELAGLQVFDRGDGALLGTPFRREAIDLLSAAFIDNDSIATGDGPGMLRIIDVMSGEPIGDEHIASETGSDIWEIVPAPDHSFLMTRSSDNTIRTWDLSGVGLSLRNTIETITKPTGVMIVRSASEVVTGGGDGYLHRIDPASGAVIEGGRSMQAHSDDRIIDTDFSDGEWMVSLGDDHRVQVWRYVGDRAPVGNSLVEGLDEVRAIALSQDAQLVAVGTATGTSVFDSLTGQTRISLGQEATSLMFGSNSEELVVGTTEGFVQVWNLTTGTMVDERAAHGGAVRRLAPEADGEGFASGADDGSIMIWKASTLAIERGLDPHPQAVVGLAYLADGETLASLSFDGQLRIHPSGDGAPVVTQLAHDGPLSLAAHPFDNLLAVGVGDERIVVTDLDGNDINSVAPHSGGAWDVAFTADGLSVVGASRSNGAVQLWDWATETRLGPAFELHEQQVVVTIGRSGIVWSAGEEGTVSRLDVLDNRAGCDISMNVLNQAMRDQFLGGGDLRSCSPAV